MTELIEEISQRLEYLKKELLESRTSSDSAQAKAHDSPNTAPTWADQRQTPAEDHHSGIDRVPVRDPSPHIKDHCKIGNEKSASKDCIMSLDISEYELQMIEMQARREELDEQSTLDFKVGWLFVLCRAETM